jgi:hypothetical protein
MRNTYLDRVFLIAPGFGVALSLLALLELLFSFPDVPRSIVIVDEGIVRQGCVLSAFFWGSVKYSTLISSALRINWFGVELNYNS